MAHDAGSKLVFDEILSSLRYLDDSLELLRVAEFLSQTWSDDVSHERNLRRVSLLITACISRFDCCSDEMRAALRCVNCEVKSGSSKID